MLCRKFGETEQEIVMLEQRLLQRKKEKKVCLLLVKAFVSINTACLSYSLFEFVMDSNMYFDEKPNVLFESHKFIRQKHNIIC